jgi:translocation and assembly module TamB
MKTVRRLLKVLAVFLILAVVVLEGGRRLLGTQYGADKVAGKLADVYGGPVKLSAVDLGYRSSILRGLRLYEMDQDPSDAARLPWITVEEVAADVTLWQALRGQAPLHQLALTNASITLRFDKDGSLLTKLPNQPGGNGAVPAIHISRSRLTLSQEGGPTLTLSGIDGDLHPESGSLVLTGRLDDPSWGQWDVKADWNQETGRGSGTLSCSRVHLTQAKLETIPLVPASVWREVNGVDGDARVALNLSTGGADGGVHYQLTVQPVRAAIQIPSIDLAGELTSGAIEVKDNLVQLRNLESLTAGGKIKTSGELDFRDARKSEMQFDIDANRLDLVKLPASWGLPRQITGNLSGKARLQLTVEDGRVHTNGEGNAVITEAKLAGDPARPIELKLHPAGKGFRFAAAAAAAQVELFRLPLLDVSLNMEPEEEPLDWTVRLPDRITDVLVNGVEFAATSILKAGQRLHSLLPKRNWDLNPPGQPGYLEIKLGMENVDLAGLMKNLGVPLPFTVGGKLSFDLKAAIPTDTPKDLKAYRLNGTASLAWLTLEDLRLENVTARVTYADGVLLLEELKAEAPDAPVAISGRVEGTARLELFPAGDLAGKATLSQFPLTRLARLIPGAAGNASGFFTGTFSLRAPIERLRDVKTWEAASTVKSERLELYGAVLENLSAQTKLHEGQISVTELKGVLEGGPVTGAAELTLAGAYGYKGNLDFRDVDLGSLRHLSPNLRAPLAVGGRLTLDVHANGTLNPVTFQARGKAQARDLELEKVKVSSLLFDWNSDARLVNLKDIRITLSRGELTGQAALPLQPRESGSVDLHFQGIELGGLAASLPPLPIQLQGRADGTLKATFPPESPTGRRTWTTNLNLHSPRLKLEGMPVEKVDGSVASNSQVVQYRFSGETLGGTFHVEGKVPLTRPAAPAPAPPDPPAQLEGGIHFKDLKLSRLWQVLGLEKVLDPLHGSIQIDLDYRANRAGDPVGRGALAVMNLRWGETRFFEGGLEGWVVLEEGLHLRSGLASSELGGLVRVQAVMNLHRPNRSTFDLTIERADVSRLLAPWPEYSAHFRGDAVVRLRGHMGQEWYASGTVGLVGGAVYGIEMSEWSLPVEMTYSPLEQQGQIFIHDSTLQFLAGRGTGQATLTWNPDTRLEGRLRFFDVELRHLQQSSELGRFGSGLLSGQVDFGGQNLHGPEDLTANLNATLKQAQALQFPVLQQLTPFLLGRMSAATVFENGDLRAQLARGIIRIERLALQSRAARLFLEGTVTIPQERLDLEAIVSTGSLELPLCCQRVVKVAVQSTNPLPVGLLLEATRHLARIALYLHVTGTVHSPTVQVQPLRGLTEKALRFLAL